tara:strand:+ start:527 stop:1855 length:1329 start_codon:yes stop_codon:yes gene_type:complete
MTSEIKVNQIKKASGSTITIGESGDTISLASGASQSGFGRSGSVDWQTTPKTSTFTAASGEGYFINSSGAITMNLPAGTAGAIVSASDYARNFSTHNFTISANGSEKIGGETNDVILNTDGQALTLIYVDSTKGWINVQNAEDTFTGASPFIVATGGTITNTPTCRIHTFTSPGTFTVCQASGVCGPTRNKVSFMVVAGGGAGGTTPNTKASGGGGGGGFRESKSPATPYTASPLDGGSPNAITITAGSFPITVGSGGAKVPSPSPSNGGSGSSSVFSSITSAGGGGGGGKTHVGIAGGSGGGAGGGCYSPRCGGAGNTPPVSPPQGQTGGCSHAGPPDQNSGGGGGAGGTGGQSRPSSNPNGSGGGAGGAGVTTEITNSPLSFSGGGAGTGASNGNANPVGRGGGAGDDGTANSGGGGGGKTSGAGGNGGSGIVVIRYKIA